MHQVILVTFGRHTNIETRPVYYSREACDVYTDSAPSDTLLRIRRFIDAIS